MLGKVQSTYRHLEFFHFEASAIFHKPPNVSSASQSPTILHVETMEELQQRRNKFLIIYVQREITVSLSCFVSSPRPPLFQIEFYVSLQGLTPSEIAPWRFQKAM